jgi:hypothetical protein
VSESLFDPAGLPAPRVMRRRHLVLAAIDARLGRGDGYYVKGDALRYDSGGGDAYGLVFDGENALLWVFDHESPYSPYAHDDDPEVWPGLLDGLPDELATHLPAGHPLAVSAAYWYVDGRWQMGAPEPATEDAGPYLSDPQGVRELVAPLLDADVSEILADYYERPELIPAAQALMDAGLDDPVAIEDRASALAA